MQKNGYLIILLIVGLSFLSALSHAQVIQSNFFDLNGVEPRSGLVGNGITDIAISDGVIWLGTGKGLSRSSDSGQTWESFDQAHGLGKGGISAMWVNGDTIWVATAYDTLIPSVSEESIDAGGGLSYSLDGGANWKHIRQPGVVNEQNITYDIAILGSTIWIATWGGGIRKFTHWEPPFENVVPDSFVEAAPDSFVFDPYGNHNHKGFSTLTAGSTLWIGTAGGINKSEDGGLTWQNFNHTNQLKPISGNFVVALGHQNHRGRNIIWAATWKAEGEDEFYAVSKSEDGGKSWSTTLDDEKAYNFAFDDSVVYVPTENGLYKSVDFGETWYKFPPIKDVKTGETVYSESFYSAAVDELGNLWVGSADGLAQTGTEGMEWILHRAFKSTARNDTPRTYAYPNPFSPTRHNQLGGDGFVRFQYNTISNTRVTIKVYDFAIDLVRTVVDGKQRPVGDFAEVWNGKNDFGDEVANGVYFYKVEIDGDGEYWGKVMIVN